MRQNRLMVVSLLICGAAPLAAAEIPLSDFARHDRYRDVKISPDGDYLAASAIVHDKAVLALIHLADMKGVNVVPRGNDELAGFWWVAPGRVMYTVGRKVGGLEVPAATGELYTVAADGSDGNLIFGYRAGGREKLATHIAHATGEFAYGELISALRDDPRHALIASYPLTGSSTGSRYALPGTGVFPEAYRIELRTGVKTRVATSPLRNARFLADPQGAVRFAFGADVDQKQKVYYRGRGGADWELVFDQAADGRAVSPRAFSQDGKSVYFDCDGDNHVGGVCRWNVATRRLETLWSGTESAPTELMLTADDNDVFAVGSMPGRPVVSVLDKSAPEARFLAALMQQFPGQRVHLGTQTRDGRKRVITVDSDTNPGDFYLFDLDTRKLTFLLSRRPWIRSDQMSPMQPVTLAARDGLVLHGYLTRPLHEETARRLPLVVCLHGGPYGIRDSWSFNPEVQLLASRGYAVLQVNFRGSGGYGVSFMQAGFRQWGAAMQDDVSDATRWAIAQEIADAGRICIFGASYGGYAALEGAVRDPDLYKCAIGYVGIYDLRLMYTRGDIPHSMFGENYLKMVLGEDQNELYDRSPIAHLDRLKAKVMLVVGGADERVPAIQGERMHQALLARKIGHEWLYVRTEGHGFYAQPHLVEMYERVLALLDEQIGDKRTKAAQIP
ncbi:MAG TPA: S9 family peptidase [Rudaea sp.]|nr:S9 family peptidase [Rudaea sp.]